MISDELSKHHQALFASYWLPNKLLARAFGSRGLGCATGDLVPGFGTALNWKFKGLLSNPALVSPPVANSQPPALSNDSGPAHPDEYCSRYMLLERKPTINDQAQHIIGCVQVTSSSRHWLLLLSLNERAKQIRVADIRACSLSTLDRYYFSQTERRMAI